MPRSFADVVFPNTVDRAFTYAIPAELDSIACVGCRAVAPFGSRTLTGFIIARKDETELDSVKALKDVLDMHAIITDEMMRLAYWIADYYMAPLAECLRAMIPAGLMQTSQQSVELNSDWAEIEMVRLQNKAPLQSAILRHLLKVRRSTVEQLRKQVGGTSLHSSLRTLEQRQLIRLRQVLPGDRAKKKQEKYIRLASQEREVDALMDELSRKAPLQAKCLTYLVAQKTEVLQKTLMEKTGASWAVIKALQEKQLIRPVYKTVLRDYYGGIEAQAPPRLILTEEQAGALSSIVATLSQKRFETFLLFGVTGSGKTQVYIEAIKQALAAGKDAIVLVPEISLTPQIVQRFRAHFQDNVAVLHSAMSAGERFDSWQRIRDGSAHVAIGPRSAVFAPLKNVGLIIVDEEHEASYKQSDTAPRYHARDIAVVRANFANAAVVLGSATPSAESFYNAQAGKYTLLELTRRVNDIAMPEVHIIDMQKERRLSGSRQEIIFSRLLANKIKEKTTLRQQVILLLNRRGFSSFIKCRECEFIEECEHCNITLTYHKHGHELCCHYCGYSKRAPEMCPNCLSPDIIFQGLGTQKVEAALKERFPEIRCVRMDLDTTRRKWSHDRILNDFGEGKYDVLLGTQMVAKGLDFDRVTLVGVINADIGMLMPDFRASERTFQLLTQVAGRAGRRQLVGEVIIQSYVPDSFCLLCAKTHDFHKFYQGEIYERRELHYPPFARMVCVHFRGEDETRVLNAAGRFAQEMKSTAKSSRVLGPSPAALVRLQDVYRYQVTLKADRQEDGSGRAMRHAVRNGVSWFESTFKPNEVKLIVDVDPISMM